MPSLTIHHIGYLVKKIDAATAQFKALGYELTQGPVYDPVRRVNISFLSKDGYVIELVSPTDSASVAAGLMKKYKNSPYHICYESHHLEEDLSFLTQNGYTAIDAPTPAPALDGRLVVFLMNPALGMIELLEAASPAAL